jgi:histidine ammonia-lyase
MGDPKTIGQLFYLCCDVMEDIRFAQAFMLILDLLKSTLLEEPVLSEEKVQSIIDELFSKLPQFLQRALLNTDELSTTAA